MYHIDGDFGKVRIIENIEKGLFPVPHGFLSIGWHQCNRKYRIRRPQGFPYYTLFFTVSGRGILRSGGREFELTGGSLAIAPPELDTEYFATDYWEFYWAHPCVRCTTILDHVLEHCGILLYPAEPEAYIAIIERILALSKTRSCYFDIEASAELSVLLHRLLLETHKTQGTPRGTTLIREITSYLETHLAEPISLPRLGEKFYITPVHLIRKFKEACSVTPYEYLIRLRIAKACQYLCYSDLSVEETARRVGFRSVSNFIRHFKLIQGVTPLAFRTGKKQQSLPDV